MEATFTSSLIAEIPVVSDFFFGHPLRAIEVWMFTFNKTLPFLQAGNDPVPGGRKPPLIPPSILAAEKEKEKEREKAKEEAKASASEAVKTEKVEEKIIKTEMKSPDSKDKKPEGEANFCGT